MTVTNPASSGAATGAEIQPREEQVAVTIDGFEISVPKGTLLIRAAELLGIQIPRFCDHPLLDPVGACRQCLVDVPDGGNGRPMPKPVASCTTTVAPGMVIRTQLTSAVADKAQKGVMELLLINHPLDCPVCDKGGECPLQNQAMSNGRGETRFTDVKRTFPKPIQISSQVLLDRERCVLCARCTRFSNQVAGDPFIEMLERGALQQVGIYEQQPFESYFSGNTVQICPVGALTGAQYRFRARPFDLVSTATACEHCASGCALRTDHRRGRVLRRLAAQDEQVNEEWNCDKGRWAFQYAAVGDRIASPMVRNAEGELIPTSWPDALATAAEGLTRARAAGVGVLVGGRVTMEDAYAYAKFARVALGTNDVDFRARVSSAEESQFLAAHVVGRTPDSGGVTYADLERAPVVLLAGLEPEEESPILFLRLRKAVRKKNLRVLAVAPFATRGLDKLQGTLVGSAPGTEPEVLDALTDEDGARRSLGEAAAAAAAGLRQPGAIVLVGERLAGVPGALSAIARLATATGSRLAWVPRRAGERGALEAGALPTLLPGGRPVADPAARVDVAAAWGVPTLPAAAGRDTAAMIQDAAAGRLGALVVGGVDPADLPDPHRATEALHGSAFVVSLEIRASEVSAHADVVLPVSPVVEKSGTFLDWEGRPRPFAAVLRDTGSLSDARVLDALAQELGLDLGTGDVAAIRGEMSELGDWEGTGVSSPAAPAGRLPRPEVGQAVLTTWHHLLDAGRLQDGEPFLAGTAKAPLARISPATAAEVGAVDGEPLTITGERATLIVPVRITPMPDRVVWLPAASAGADARTLGTPAGGVVRLTGPRQPVASGSSAPSGTSALSGSSALSGTSALEGRP